MMMHLPSLQQLVESGIKHFPPSPSDLHLLDVGGRAMPYLQARRDIVPQIASLYLPDWQYDDQTMDAIIAVDYPLHMDFLQAALRILRPGGRLVCLFTTGVINNTTADPLKRAGYGRILAETATSQGGLLVRGERLHTTADTLARVQVAAGRDADTIDWASYKGRYVHFLIKQTPNKPVWKLSSQDHIQWHAVALQRADVLMLFAFSSLPKAVAFMQPAVMKSIVHDVNKVGKFSIETVRLWQEKLWLNPDIDSVENILKDTSQSASIMDYEVDVTQAEQPDE